MWRRTEKIVKNLRLISLGLFMSSFDFFIDMKNCLIGFVCLIFSFCLGSCCSAKPVATTHTERIETHLQPITMGADTIEITEYRLQSTDNRVQSTDYRPQEFLLLRLFCVLNDMCHNTQFAILFLIFKLQLSTSGFK